jgi:hypothetical protein
MYYVLWVYVCNLSYPACTAHAPCYIVISVLSGCTIFSAIFDKRHDFLENVIEHKNGRFDFARNISYSKKN